MVSCSGPATRRLPLPNMLMFDRITHIRRCRAARTARARSIAELDIRPDLWFFGCHFEGDPVMPGCLGLDALWQLVGFLARLARQPGRGPRAGRRRDQVLRAGAARRASKVSLSAST
jgi:3-hydroxyacyl-[acyl-carrier protein] dehydratase/trans-2-decenoyl-[acyl-carrier protein] isomerase